MFVAHSSSAVCVAYPTLLELEGAMNGYLRTHLPQFCDASMSEFLEFREAPAGGSMGVWVRDNVVIEAGFPLGAYMGRLCLRGALSKSAYIFSMKRFPWRGRQICTLEIDGAPYGRPPRTRIANVASYNHCCINETVFLRHTAWTQIRMEPVVAGPSTTRPGPGVLTRTARD